MRSCAAHFPRALEEDRLTMRQFGITGKSFEQQSHQVARALEAFRILYGLREYADRAANHLYEALLESPSPRLGPVVRKLALAFLNLSHTPQGLSQKNYHRRTGAFASLCRDLRLSRMETLYEDCAVASTETLHTFATTLLSCVRPVLRSSVVQGHERATWILLRKYLQELAEASAAILDEREEAEYQERLREAAEEEDDDWTLEDIDLENELWEDGDGADFEEADEEEEALAAAEAAAAAAVVAVAPAVGEAPLAAFVNDHQNVHTAPARNSAERVLSAFLPDVGPTLRSLCEARQIRLPSEERLAAFLECVQDDPPQALEEPIVRIDADGRPHTVNLVVSYGGLVRFALDRCLKSSPSHQYGILQGLLAHISGGYRAERALRLHDLGDFLCCWMPELLPLQMVDNADSYTAAHWALFWNDTLLQSIHEAWTEALTSVKEWKPWTEVLEDAGWAEFRHDVDTVSNFGVTYAELLMEVWYYAKKQPTDIKREIAVRLAEEVLDGLGMCEQGKMTRLTNVLRGFHPALDDVVVLSVGEQLQNRMAVISRLPAEERRAAADAVFAELGVPADEQGAWIDALGDFVP